VTPPQISRRAFVAAAAGVSAACQKPKATGILGYCFIANHASRSVSVLDLSRFRVRTHIALDAAPLEVVAPAKPARAYVLARENATVYEIDAIKLAVTRRVRLGNEAGGMRLSRSGDGLWVLLRDPAAMVEVPFNSLRPARRVSFASPPDAFELSRETNEACVVTRKDRSLSIVSLDQAAVSRTIIAAAEPSIANFRRDGKHLLAGSEVARNVTIYDTAIGKTVVTLPLGLAPRHFCTTRDGGQLYITGEGMDAVVTVYPYRTEVAETRLAGRAPGAMAVTETEPGNPTPSFLMVANPGEDRVTVLDVETGKLAALVQVGRDPGQILVTPDRQYALVLNEGSGDVAVIRTFSLAGNQEGGGRVKRYKSAPLFTMVPVGERPVSAAVVVFSS
jgi:DNA-binding beta-propeller fold protein YncE